MKKTTNYDLNVVEGVDKVNLLTQMNPNTEKIDEQMKKNENSGVQSATELLSGSIHAITRSSKTASMFKFTAVSNYTAGDTFTVDGKQVTALLTSGEALGTGAFIIGSEVLCSLKDTLLTVYTNGGTALLASDSEKLGGNLPEYYAKQNDLTQVSDVANSASQLSRKNSTDINALNSEVVKTSTYISKNIYARRNLQLNFTNGKASVDISNVYRGSELIGFGIFPYNSIENCKCYSSNGNLTVESSSLNGSYYVSIVCFFSN